MPQGNNGTPLLFIKVIIEVIKDIDRIAAYLDEVIVFDPDPKAHVANIRSLFERLRKHNLKLSPSKSKIGATDDVDFLGRTISSSGDSPSADSVTALTKASMPKTTP